MPYIVLVTLCCVSQPIKCENPLASQHQFVLFDIVVCNILKANSHKYSITCACERPLIPGKLLEQQLHSSQHSTLSYSNLFVLNSWFIAPGYTLSEFSKLVHQLPYLDDLSVCILDNPQLKLK